FLPLVVVAMLLEPMRVASFKLAEAYMQGASDVFAPVAQTLNEATWVPELFHLWFLNYLVWIVALTLPLVALLERLWPTGWRPQGWARRWVERPWQALLVVGGVNTAWWLGFDWLEVHTDGSWLPDPMMLVYYWGCYLMGWLVYSARPDLSGLREHGATMLGLGLAMATAKGLCMVPLFEQDWDPSQPFPDALAWIRPVIAALGATGAVALSMGLAGVFLRAAGEESRRWRTLSDGSYWIYVVHMLLVGPVAAPLVGLPVPAPLLSIVAIVAVFLLCWWSYLALVRWTAIGAFFNGRRYASPTRLRSLGALVGLGIAWTLLGVALHESRAAQPQGSPWRDGRSAEDLLVDYTVQDPYMQEPPGVPEVRLDRCIGVDDYVLCPDEATWHGAVLACKALGAVFVSLPTQAEADRLEGIVAALTEQPMLISLSDGVEEGRWVWLDGSELAYSPWAPGEPNNYGGPEGCATINYEGNNGWHDFPCEVQLGFICEQRAP
ncbi:MAG TPA: hypothetical protein DFR83_27760, partial [Deltaproteobacteria bacterium]|nr:hypothetical protein [Deltaproteobacteria bacterium]